MLIPAVEFPQALPPVATYIPETEGVVGTRFVIPFDQVYDKAPVALNVTDVPRQTLVADAAKVRDGTTELTLIVSTD